jgi:predicted  nucleic acid-binding Zn-ribbon protein
MGDSAVEIHTGGGEETPPGTGRIFLGAGGDLFSDIGKSFSQVKDILSSLTELAGGETTRQGVQGKFAGFETFTERIESATSSMETKLPETWDNLDRRLNATQTMFEDLKAKTEKMKPDLEQSLQKAEHSIQELRRDTGEEVQAARKKIATFRESALEKIAAWQKLSSSCRESIPAQVKSGRDWTDRFAPTAAKLDNLLSNADEQLNQGGESTRTMLKDLGGFAVNFEETTFRIKRWPGSFSHQPEKDLAEAHDLVWRRELACRQYVELRAELERAWNELKNSDKADRERLEWVEQILREADNAFEPGTFFEKGQNKRSK